VKREKAIIVFAYKGQQIVKARKSATNTLGYAIKRLARCFEHIFDHTSGSVRKSTLKEREAVPVESHGLLPRIVRLTRRSHESFGLLDCHEGQDAHQAIVYSCKAFQVGYLFSCVIALLQMLGFQQLIVARLQGEPLLLV
jgi:hypothetical protein